MNQNPKTKKQASLIEIAAEGRLPRVLKQYLKKCRPEVKPESCKKKAAGRFPNLAGFCRYLGYGLGEFDRLQETDPDSADYLLAVMEDEALNSEVLSATLASAYLKGRVEYSKREKGEESIADCGEMRVIFEHDITEDGA